MNTIIKQSKVFFNRNGPTILSCIGSAGVILTSIMSARATIKSVKKLNDVKEKDELTKSEIVRICAPNYIPVAVVGSAAIACILGSNALNRKTQATIMSAYVLLDSAFKQYKNKTAELYGRDSDIKIKESISKDTYVPNLFSNSETELFYDYYANRYFESTVDRVRWAEYYINRKVFMGERATLNDFYNFLGVSTIKGGDILEWRSWIDFEHDNVTMDDGLECCIISIKNEPSIFC